jgi:hypothetical protein
MASRTRPRILVRQVVVGSLATWSFTALLSVLIHFFGDKPWGEALQIATFFGIVLLLAYGAVGLGGGMMVIPPGVFRSGWVARRERVTDDPGGLTPLGLALFVVPQLALIAVLLG